jgi:inositol oxygenase
MFLWGDEHCGQKGTAEGPQWALGGDTWVVGAKIPDCVVFPEFNSLNPDMSNAIYSKQLGIYEPHCGIDNLFFAYGHDEYLYQMVVSSIAYRRIYYMFFFGIWKVNVYCSCLTRKVKSFEL